MSVAAASAHVACKDPHPARKVVSWEIPPTPASTQDSGAAPLELSAKLETVPDNAPVLDIRGSLHDMQYASSDVTGAASGVSRSASGVTGEPGAALKVQIPPLRLTGEDRRNMDASLDESELSGVVGSLSRTPRGTPRNSATKKAWRTPRDSPTSARHTPVDCLTPRDSPMKWAPRTPRDSPANSTTSQPPPSECVTPRNSATKIFLRTPRDSPSIVNQPTASGNGNGAGATPRNSAISRPPKNPPATLTQPPPSSDSSQVVLKGIMKHHHLGTPTGSARNGARSAHDDEVLWSSVNSSPAFGGHGLSGSPEVGRKAGDGAATPGRGSVDTCCTPSRCFTAKRLHITE